ncbi:hypothetical protein H6F67_17545 [Microcoleus sp. FACHB-1515]|uniref:hypothetical protein n=1 Tax=Cyanophyceae TaxID=3028117 RepID=UPI0016839258|nr:hypothetical protein [Microcoleus sp. FACHB-1515]MBD2091650.1 hypothetical protein [Microcoleus sp. FACHB-1515]
MRRARLFFSRFAIALWAVVTIAFLMLLTSNAPRVPKYTPFASLAIRADSIVHLPNRIFTCTRENQQFECQAEIQNRLLKVNLSRDSQYQFDDYQFSRCDAFFDGKSIECENVGSTYAPVISQLYEVKNLGLSASELRSIQQQYWGINLLMQLGEIRIFWISTGLSIAAGLIAASFAWQCPNKLTKIFASLMCGLGAYQIGWSFLGRVPFDAVTPYGIVPETWSLMVQVLAIATGIAATIATIALLGQRSNRAIRVLLSLGISASIFGLCWQVFGWVIREIAGFVGFSFGIDTSTIATTILQTWLSAAAIAPAIVAAVLLWSRTPRSIKAFLAISSGFGAVAIATNFFLFLLLGLGYAD